MEVWKAQTSSGGLEGPNLDAVDGEVGAGREGGVAEGGALLAAPLVEVLVEPEAEVAGTGAHHQVTSATLGSGVSRRRRQMALL